ncbi:MAG: FtsK/SpoIIIE domain-containing protein, partial [Armatimonadota bacterium]|nr:FtsK/SpoIIIE domain-containing protein [Armatimonadota bacterium]
MDGAMMTGVESGPVFEIVDRGAPLKKCRVTFDQAPPKDLLDHVIQAIGERAKESMKVEVAFADLLKEAKYPILGWDSDLATKGLESKEGIRIPLGPTARDTLFFQFDSNLRVHALVVGRPGSGKTNLMHVMITSLALAYSPDELELYLIDFKKGVGFKAYANHELPHARVIAIESEREFGISVLRELDRKLTERGELFRAANHAEKLEQYRNYTGKDMPRIVLIADEFQEFFTVEDAIAREASLLFDRIVRQGRSFGVHLILGTQTLAGSYGLAKSTTELISVRIALQCSDADSRLILADDNPGARYLTRPGEAIYNHESGTVAANRLFQVALFTDADKEEYLTQIRTTAENLGKPGNPIVFEGDAPAKLEHSKDVAALLQTGEKANLKKGVCAWLGEPIAIRTPAATMARFRRQAGANLLVVTRDEEQGMGIIAAALTTLAIQHPGDSCRFIIVDNSTTDADWADFTTRFCDLIPHEHEVIRRRQVPETVAAIAGEMDALHARNAPPAANIFFVIFGLQRSRELRKEEDDYSGDSSADKFIRILREGPEVGIHCLVWVDTPAGVLRTLGRKAITEFGLRVAGVMSNEDSQTLLDDSSAAKIDRPHR